MYTDPSGYQSIDYFAHLSSNEYGNGGGGMDHGWGYSPMQTTGSTFGRWSLFGPGGYNPYGGLSTSYHHSNGTYYNGHGQQVTYEEVHNNYIVPNAFVHGYWKTVGAYTGTSMSDLTYRRSGRKWVVVRNGEVKPQGGGVVTVPYIVNGLETTAQAINHYYNGNGTPVTLGNNSVDALIKSKKFQYHHNRIISGQTTRLTGNFSVSLVWTVFHIGDTNVNYSITVGPESCTVTYELFADDGFWDVDYLNEYTLGTMGHPNFIPDGIGPNLEGGGTPYSYIPIIGTYTFPNPGY